MTQMIISTWIPIHSKSLNPTRKSSIKTRSCGPTWKSKNSNSNTSRTTSKIRSPSSRTSRINIKCCLPIYWRPWKMSTIKRLHSSNTRCSNSSRRERSRWRRQRVHKSRLSWKRHLRRNWKIWKISWTWPSKRSENSRPCRSRVPLRSRRSSLSRVKSRRWRPKRSAWWSASRKSLSNTGSGRQSVSRKSCRSNKQMLKRIGRFKYSSETISRTSKSRKGSKRSWVHWWRKARMTRRSRSMPRKTGKKRRTSTWTISSSGSSQTPKRCSNAMNSNRPSYSRRSRRTQSTRRSMKSRNSMLNSLWEGRKWSSKSHSWKVCLKTLSLKNNWMLWMRNWINYH